MPGEYVGVGGGTHTSVDVAVFADAGVSWNADERPEFAGGSRRVVRSVGGAVRINLFGLLPLELAVSRPFDRVDKKLRWQIGIRQGF